MRSTLRRLGAILLDKPQSSALELPALAPLCKWDGATSIRTLSTISPMTSQSVRHFSGRQNVSRDRVQRAAASESAAKGTPLWLSNYVPTPPVQFMPGHEKPRAMGWLYRRGPELPRGVLQKLFRQRQVRVLSPDGVTVRRVKPDSILQPGELVFVPRAAVAAQAVSEEAGPTKRGRDQDMPAGGRGSSPPARKARAPDRLPSRSREPPQPASFRPKDLVLHADRNLLIVNKPAMLPMDAAGQMGVMAVDTVFTPRALGLRSSVALLWPYGLETAASGALILAKDEEIALELREAVLRKRVPVAAGRKRDFAFAPKEVKQMFWALLDGRKMRESPEEDSLPKSGVISVDVREKGGRKAPPVSAIYRIKATTDDGLMWVELRPSTGRCALHLTTLCAEGLGCPIVCDPVRLQTSEPHSHLLADNGRKIGSGAWPQDTPSLPFLHARSVVVQFIRADTEPLSVTAPLPRHMVEFWDRMGWDYAITSFKRPSRQMGKNDETE